jgi:formate dehydrogenase maturation protein FdhE
LTKKILKIILEKLASYQDKSKRVLNLKLKRQIIEEKEMIEKGNHRKEYLELFLRLPESVIANLMMTMMRTIKSKLSKRIQKTIEKLQHLDQIMRMKKTMTTISMQLMKFQLTSY